MPPHMKKACSGYSSNSPAHSRLNESIVSSTGTNEPGMPVNCSATNVFCDRKRSMRRARCTVIWSSGESSSMPRIAMMSCSSLYRWRIVCTVRATS